MATETRTPTSTEYDSRHLTPRRVWQGLAAVVLVLVIVSVPRSIPLYQLDLVNIALIAALGAVALNLLTGIAGLVSLGNAAFMAISAFTACQLAIEWHWPFLPTVLAASLASGIVGCIIAIPALRVKGLYLALATLALQYVVVYAATAYEAAKVGPTGFTMPEATLFGVKLADQENWYWPLVALVVLCFFGARNLLRSNVGRAWQMMRDRPAAARAHGISVSMQTILAFTVTSTLIGLSGVLGAYYQSNVDVGTYDLQLTIQAVAMVVIGGWGSIGGSIVGAFLVTFVPTFLQNVVNSLPSGIGQLSLIQDNLANISFLLYGLIIVVILLVEPGGLAALGRRIIHLLIWTIRSVQRLWRARGRA